MCGHMRASGKFLLTGLDRVVTVPLTTSLTHHLTSTSSSTHSSTNIFPPSPSPSQSKSINKHPSHNLTFSHQSSIIFINIHQPLPCPPWRVAPSRRSGASQPASSTPRTVRQVKLNPRLHLSPQTPPARRTFRSH